MEERRILIASFESESARFGRLAGNYKYKLISTDIRSASPQNPMAPFHVFSFEVPTTIPAVYLSGHVHLSLNPSTTCSKDAMVMRTSVTRASCARGEVELTLMDCPR